MPRRGVLSVTREHHASLVAFGFRLEAPRLLPVGIPTRDEWLQCLHYLMHLERHIHFWLGDLMVYGEDRWGEVVVRHMVEATGYHYETLRNLKWVASSVHVSRRRQTLSFAHHQEAAKLPPAQQQLVLARAETGRWTHKMVRQEAFRLTHTVARSQQLTLDPRLHLGDCRQAIATLPDASIDLLLTDPPYGIDYESPTRIIPFPHMVDDDTSAATLLDEAFGCVRAKLRPSTPVCVFTSWKTLLEMVNVVANHFTVRRTLSWAKNVWGVGDLEGNYGDQHELVIFADNGPRRLTGRALRCDRVGTNQLRHPTQKPVPLLQDLISKLSREGDTVLDPFMGSGSTCVAARKTQRRYIGIEIDQQWYAQALQRLAGPASEE
jgi:site-specific DNA-methyltransferase (adenine-specific)